MPTDAVTVGIDVGNRRVNVHFDPLDRTLHFDHTPQAIADLVEQLRQHRPARIVVELVGGYEKALVQALAGVDAPVTLIRPGAVRDFAKASGMLDGGDHPDAAVLARLARHAPSPVDQAPDAQREALRQMVMRRRHLVEEYVSARFQLTYVTLGMVRASIHRTIAHLQIELMALETEIRPLVHANEELRQRCAILERIVGVTPTIAQVLVTDLPELGRIPSNRLTAMVGLAPTNDNAGQRQGKRHDRGAPGAVHRSLYLASLLATRRHGVIRTYFQRLRERGKPRKVAIVACMRKVLIYCNVTLRDAQPA